MDQTIQILRGIGLFQASATKRKKQKRRPKIIFLFVVKQYKFVFKSFFFYISSSYAKERAKVSVNNGQYTHLNTGIYLKLIPNYMGNIWLKFKNTRIRLKCENTTLHVLLACPHPNFFKHRNRCKHFLSSGGTSTVDLVCVCI